MSSNPKLCNPGMTHNDQRAVKEIPGEPFLSLNLHSALFYICTRYIAEHDLMYYFSSASAKGSNIVGILIPFHWPLMEIVTREHWRRGGSISWTPYRFIHTHIHTHTHTYFSSTLPFKKTTKTYWISAYYFFWTKCSATLKTCVLKLLSRKMRYNASVLSSNLKPLYLEANSQ